MRQLSLKSWYSTVTNKLFNSPEWILVAVIGLSFALLAPFSTYPNGAWILVEMLNQNYVSLAVPDFAAQFPQQLSDGRAHILNGFQGVTLHVLGLPPLEALQIGTIGLIMTNATILVSILIKLEIPTQVRMIAVLIFTLSSGVIWSIINPTLEELYFLTTALLFLRALYGNAYFIFLSALALSLSKITGITLLAVSLIIISINSDDRDIRKILLISCSMLIGGGVHALLYTPSNGDISSLGRAIDIAKTISQKEDLAIGFLFLCASFLTKPTERFSFKTAETNLLVLTISMWAVFYSVLTIATNKSSIYHLAVPVTLLVIPCCYLWGCLSDRAQLKLRYIFAAMVFSCISVKLLNLLIMGIALRCVWTQSGSKTKFGILFICSIISFYFLGAGFMFGPWLLTLSFFLLTGDSYTRANSNILNNICINLFATFAILTVVKGCYLLSLSYQSSKGFEQLVDIIATRKTNDLAIDFSQLAQVEVPEYARILQRSLGVRTDRDPSFKHCQYVESAEIKNVSEKVLNLSCGDQNADFDSNNTLVIRVERLGNGYIENSLRFHPLALFDFKIQKGITE